MDKLSLCVLLFSLFTVLTFPPVASITTEYLNQICDSSVSVTRSRRLESSTALFYEPQVSCFYTVTVPANRYVMLLVRLFDVESRVNGNCVDYVNIHDGSSTGDPALNSSPLCADDAQVDSNFTATGNTMTVYFHTDSTGARRGFDFIFVAISTGICGSEQFACNSSICIHKDLQCTVFDECGDDSDEMNCQYETPTGVELHDKTGLIIGLSLGLFLGLVVGAILGYMCYRHHIRWRLFLKRPLTVDEVVHEETNFASAYPVTKTYYKDKFQSIYQTPTHPPAYARDQPKGYITGKETVTSVSQNTSQVAMTSETSMTTTN